MGSELVPPLPRGVGGLLSFIKDSVMQRTGAPVAHGRPACRSDLLVPSIEDSAT